MKSSILKTLIRTFLFVTSFLLFFSLMSCNKFISKPYNAEKSTAKDKNDFLFKRNYYKGVKEKLLGNYDKSQVYFNACLKLNKEVPSLYYELSQLAYINEDYEKAVELASKAYQMDNENVWYGSYLLSIYEYIGDFDNAKKIIKRLIEKQPNNLDFKLELAKLYENDNKYEEAIKVFDEIEKTNGINEDISIEKEKLYLKLNKPDKAVEEIKRLLEKNPDKVEYYGELSTIYMHMNKPDEAYKMIKKILSLEPNNGKAYLSLSEYYQLSGKTDSAFYALSKAFASQSLDINTKVKVAYNYMKYYTLDTINYNKIDTLVRVLLEKYPKNIKSYTLASDYYSQKKDLKKAKKYLLVAKTMDKNNYLIWEQLMYIDNHYKDYDSLIKHGREAISLFPLISRFYLYTGIAYYMKNHYDSATYFLKKGIKYNVDSTLFPNFYYFTAEAYYRLGKIDSSFYYYDNLLKIDPKNIGAMNNYSYFMALQNRNLDKADSLMQIVLKYFPAEPNYLDTYGWVLYKKGEYQKALEYLKKAINNGGDKSSTILEHYADALFRNGKIKEAVKYWKQAYSNSKDQKQKNNLLQKIQNHKIIE